MSPRPGISTLITSAPIHANNCVPVGPAWTWLRSRTRTPSRALLMQLASTCRPVAGRGDAALCGRQKIAVPLDMRGETQGVFTCQPLCKLGLAAFERLNDLHMVKNRSGRPVVLVDRDLTDRAHVDEQVFRHLGEQRTAAHANDRLVKGDVCIRIIVESLAAVA